MPIDLTPEELSFYNERRGNQNPLDQPDPQVGRMGLMGAAVDSTQGRLYRLLEDSGVDFARDARLANEAQANRTRDLYYRQTGNPRSFGEAEGLGEFLSVAGDAAVQSLPEMGAIVGSALINPYLGYATAATLGTADVADNMYEAGGRANYAAAVPLGMAYGASDMLLGTTAGLARKGLGTGVRALDDVGSKALDGLTGWKGVGARMGVNTLKRGAAEAVDETFQGAMNQLGRTTVSDETMTGQTAMDNYYESAVGGGVVGAMFGLPTSGLRTRPKVEDQPNLLARGGSPVMNDAAAFKGGLIPAREPGVLERFGNDLKYAYPQVGEASPVDLMRIGSEFQSLGVQQSGEISPVDGAPVVYPRGQSQGVSQQIQDIGGAWQSMQPSIDQPLTSFGSRVSPEEAAAVGNMRSRDGMLQSINDQMRGVELPQSGEFSPVGSAPQAQPAPEQPAAPVGTTGKGAGATQPTQADPDADLKQILSDAGIKPNKKGLYSTSHLAAAKAIAAADLDDETRTLAINTLGRGKLSKVEGIINEAKSQSSVQPVATTTAPVGTQSPATQAATTGPQTGAGPVAKAGTAVGSADTGAIKVATPIEAGRTVEVGSGAHRKTVTAGKLRDVISGSTDSEADKLFRERLGMLVGGSYDTDPDTGKPILVIDGEPASFSQVAEAELGGSLAGMDADSRAKAIDNRRKAIQIMLQRRGVSQSVIDAAVGFSPEAMSDAEAGGIEGLRYGDTLAEAAGEPQLFEVKVSKSAADESDVDAGGDQSKKKKSIKKRTPEQIAEAEAKKAAAEAKKAAAEEWVKQNEENLKAGSTEKYDPSKDAARADNERRAREQLASAVASVENTPEGRVAAGLWNEMHSEIEFGSLTTRQKYTWFAELADHQRGISNGKSIEDIQRAVEDAAIKARDSASEVPGRLAPTVDQAAGRTEDDRQTESAGGVTTTSVTPEALFAAEVNVARGKSMKASAMHLKLVKGLIDAGLTAHPQVGVFWKALASSEAGKAKAFIEATKPEQAAQPAQAVDGNKTLSLKAKKPDVTDVTPNQTQAQTNSTTEGQATGVDRPAGSQVSAKESISSRTAEDRDGVGLSVAEVVADLKDFLRRDVLGRRVVVVQRVWDLPKGVTVSSKKKTQGVAFDDGPRGRVAYLIADNLSKSKVRSVFLHEVGSHLGLDNMLKSEDYAAIINQMKVWAVEGRKGSTKLEHRLAVEAMDSVRRAVKKPEHYRSEVLAYFIEAAVDAGVDPTATRTERGPILAFMTRVFELFGKVLTKLGVKPEKLTAQDLVDLAYGAAQLEMTDSGPVAYGESLDNNTAKFSIAIPKNSESLLRSIGGTTATKLAADLGGYAKQALNSMTYLPDLVDDLKNSIPAASTWYKGMMDVQARRNQLAEKAERIAAKVDKLTNGAKAVNAFLAKSTMAGKWGYDITIDGTKVQADPAMAVEFNKLLPDEQALVKDVFQNGIETLKAKRDILKKLGLNDSLFVGGGTMMTPYAPLKRFGNFVAVAKSKELLAATKEDDIERLKKDPKHYLVSHFDTRGQAKVWAQEKANEFAFTDSFPKEERASELGVTNMALLNKVLAAVKASDLPTESMEAMRTLVQDMYFQAVDEHNARTAGLQRMGRYGFEEDMMRSFLHNAKAQANFLAHLEFGGEVNDAFYKMKAQAKDSVTGKRSHQDAFNMLTAHYADSLKIENTPIQDRITAFTSVMQLATSIGYHVANFTQTFMVSGPKLAADFNNWHGAMGHIFRAYPLLRNINLSGNFNFDAIKDTGLRNMLQRAADMGVLDVGMDENLSHLEATRTGYAALDKTGSVLNKAVHNLRKVSRAVETANRVAAAVAGYRMSMESKNDVDAAQAYAIRLLQTTQGDFSRTAAPLLLKRLPKVMVQYKKFQFMMAALYVRGFNDAFRGETPEVRATGRRLLAYQLAHTSVAAGALGLPLVNAIGTFMLGLLGDDDEPKDLERWLREKIDDQFMADAILKGPASMIGLDLSAKLGHDKIFSVLPYTDVDFTSAKGFRDMAFGLIGGASGSQVAKMMDGFGYLSRGDYQKGFENLTPKGVADMSKAFRIANEGFTLKDGTTMVSTEDINGAALAFDALGMKSSAVRRMEWLRGQQYEIRQFYSDKTSELKREYVRATKDGDGDTKAKLRDEWMRLQASKREMRRWFGDSDDALKTSPLSDLTKAPLQAAKKDLRAQRQFAAGQ